MSSHKILSHPKWLSLCIKLLTLNSSLSATRRPSAPLPAVETKAARQVPSEFI